MGLLKKLFSSDKPKTIKIKYDKSENRVHYNSQQQEIIFLYWCSKHTPLKNGPFPQWIKLKLEADAGDLMGDLIIDEYLEPAPLSVELEKLKVDELKRIASKHGLSTSGKKADLIKAITSCVDKSSLKLPKHYVLTEAGKEYIETPEAQNIIPAFYNRYDISFYEYFCTLRSNPTKSPREILWLAMDEQQENYEIDDNYGLARNVVLHRAYYFHDEKNYEKALEYYIKTIYYDISRCKNTGHIEKESDSLLAPGVVKHIKNLSKYYSEDMIEKCNDIELPRKYSLKKFKILIENIINNA